MDDSNLFTAGPRLGDPSGNPDREAVDALRGYSYQLYASALAWLALADGETLHLEVAEDYAVAAEAALQGVQVKDTPANTVTIRSVAASIDAFVDLVQRNPGRTISLRYLTTSQIGRERALEDRVDNESTLRYWRLAAQGAPVQPLRQPLLRLNLKAETKAFIEGKSDEELRRCLIQRIHWDVGQPSLEGLGEDLESGLVEFSVSTLKLSGEVGRQMVDPVLVAVLKTTVKPGQRRLRRADLIAIGERLGRVSVSRDLYEGLIARAAGTDAFDRKPLLVTGEGTLFGPVAARTDLIGTVKGHLALSSFAVVCGSTGMGKSHVASQAADAKPWCVADLRGLEAAAVSSRLQAILAEASLGRAEMIVLDDLDCLDDQMVARAVKRLVVAMRRRDGGVVVTCALSPTQRSIDFICGSPCVMTEVPYLTVEEVADLVAQAGGDAKLAKLIHLAGSAGHPQLVQAAIVHMRSRQWERSAIRDLFATEGSSLTEEKRAARDRFVSAMPPAARSMLFRTSLILGRFTRELALELGDVDPAISEPGAEIDRLIGPWIERPSRNDLRVSPLVANAGNAVLAPNERLRVHKAVAGHYLTTGAISVTDGDAILYHTLKGGDPKHVLAVGDSLVNASSDTLRSLAEFSPAIAAMTTEEPVFSGDRRHAGLLRLGQLLVTLSGDDTDRAAQVWQAIKAEMADLGVNFEAAVLSKILVQTVLVTAIPEWLELVLRFDALMQSHPKLREVASAMRQKDGAIPGEPQGFAFIHQAMALGSTSLLLTVFQRLGRVAPEVRGRLFSSLEPHAGYYSHLVNSAWILSAKTEDFDGEQAASDFLAMALIAEGWDNSVLAGRCHVARAIMLDEYVKSPSRALEALDEAEARLGRMTAFSRARAKLLWRQRDHLNALRGLAEVWNLTTGDNDEVERGFIAREAGISAAETGDWATAQTWFERARTCFEPFTSGALPAMKIGLLADAATAAFRAGNEQQAIEGHATALRELAGLDADGSLYAAYCHRVVRHSVLWIMRETVAGAQKIDLIQLPPGACSNPEPSEAIRTVPLGSIDIAWYMLADAALALGQVEFFRALYGHLAQGPILGLEVERHYKHARYLVLRDDCGTLLQTLGTYGSGLAYLEARSVEATIGDLLNPTRASFPHFELDGNEPAAVRRGAFDLLTSFGIVRAIHGDTESLRLIRKGVDHDAMHGVRLLAKFMNGAEGEGRLRAELTALAIAQVAKANGVPVDPDVALAATVRFAIWAQHSAFRNELADPVGAWARATWTTIIEDHRFRLRNPGEVSDAIFLVLKSVGGPLQIAARLALAAEAGAQLRIAQPLREQLIEVGREPVATESEP